MIGWWSACLLVTVILYLVGNYLNTSFGSLGVLINDY